MRPALPVAAVVLANAGIQALLVAPGLAPAVSPAFLGAAAASTVSFVVASTAVIVLVGAPGPTRPRVLRALAAVVVALVVVGGLAILSSATLVPSLVVAIAMASPAGNAGAGAVDTLRAVARRPLRAVLRAVVTSAVVVAGTGAALLLGFFLAGAIGAFATWVVVGLLTVPVVGAWARAPHRSARLAAAPATP